MRERAELLGGHLSAGPADGGGFVVAARLPLPPDETGDPVTIRVALADDQQLIRAGFRSLLEAEPDLEVVGEAATGREAVALVTRERPDVVLMDIRMPDGDGLWATEQIVANPPWPAPTSSWSPPSSSTSTWRRRSARERADSWSKTPSRSS